MDVWAPGENIYAAIANNDTAYSYYQGTSMASPAIAGMIANLLWIDENLSFYAIKTILKSHSITLSGDKCDDYECIYPIYNCSIEPSKHYDNNLEPTTTEIKEYILYDGVVEYDLCNYFAIAEIDPFLEDSNNYNNYFIDTLVYGATDKCIAERESDDYSFSYSLECITNTSANLVIWDNTDCSGDGTIIKTLYSGEMIDDDWYIIDCDNAYDRYYEETDNYDDSDCDIVMRVYLLDDDEQECDDDSTTFYDIDAVFGACNVVSNATYTYSYEYLCLQNGSDYSLVWIWYYHGGIWYVSFSVFGCIIIY